MKTRAIEIRSSGADDSKLAPLARLIADYYEKHSEERARVDAKIAENERN